MNKISKLLGVALTVTVVASLLLMSVPAGALSVPTVSFKKDHDIISLVNVEQTITFTLGKQLNGNTDTITITFPDGYKDKIKAVTATIQASPGWFDSVWTDAVLDVAADVPAFTIDAAKRQIICTLDNAGHKIGEQATVLIKVTAGITNPDTAGDYTLTVATNEETTLVESAAYAIKEPKPTKLPGIVDVYNKAGILMKSFTGTDAVQDALDYATGDEWTVKIGAGTYGPGGATFDTPAFKKQKFVAAGTAAETVWEGAITLDAEEATIDGITIKGGLVTITGKKAALKNCVFEKKDDKAAEVFVLHNAAVEAKIENCTFDTTKGDITTDLVINVDAGGWDKDMLTISGCTFTLDDGDTAIDLGADAKVTGNTITGADDNVGINISGVAGTLDKMEISGNTIDGLEKGIVINALNTVTIKDNTIQNSTDIGIDVDAVTVALVHNNTITGAPKDQYAMEIANDLDDEVFVMFNTITDNAKGLKYGGGGKLDARNNWWGSDAGPGKDDLDKSDKFEYEPWLTGATDKSIAMIPVAGATVNLEIGADSGKKLIGVGIKGEDTDDDAVGTAPLVMAAATYSANPVYTPPPPPAKGDPPPPPPDPNLFPPGTATKFFDVYVDNTGSDVNKYTISLYGAVTEDSLTYAWGAGLGEWVLCESKIKDVPNFVNLYSGAVTIYVTSTSIPTISDLTGVPLAIVEPEAEEEPTPAPTIMFPEVGAENVSVNPVLGWEAVEDAEGFGYEMAICEEPTFTIVDYAASPTQNFHAVADSLMYSTTYYWKVRAIIGAPELVGSGKDVKTVIPGGPWTTGVFSTEAEPAVPEAPVFTCPQCGLEYATQEALEAHFNRAHAEPETVVETVEKAVIPSTLLWAIVAIGAVLVIAVIVLIVRTRRVA